MGLSRGGLGVDARGPVRDPASVPHDRLALDNSRHRLPAVHDRGKLSDLVALHSAEKVHLASCPTVSHLEISSSA